MNDLTNEAEVETALAALITAATSEALRQGTEGLRDSILAEFLSEGATSGARWAQRRKTGDGHPLLVLTGALLSSLTDPADPDHIERQVTAKETLFGTRLRYAGYLQSGTRHMPARPILTAQLLGGIQISWPVS